MPCEVRTIPPFLAFPAVLRVADSSLRPSRRAGGEREEVREGAGLSWRALRFSNVLGRSSRC